MIRCVKCNGTNIEQKYWLNPNTNEIFGEVESDDIGDNWCRDCEDHVELLFEDDDEIPSDLR